MLARWLARQLANPVGIGGAIVGHLMNRSNAEMNRRAVELLEVRASHAVLDVGFGGGLTFRALLARAAEGIVAGVDPSADMVAAARRRLANPVAAGRLRLEVGTVERLPFDDATFDRAVSVNTIYFWPDVAAALREVRRVLRPDGVLVLGYRPAHRLRRTSFARHGFRLLEDEEVLDHLASAGFETLAVEESNAGLGHVCVVAGAHTAAAAAVERR